MRPRRRCVNPPSLLSLVRGRVRMREGELKLTGGLLQDKTVLIWSKDTPTAPWTKTALDPSASVAPAGAAPAPAGKFPDVVWRVSWSLAGNILAVSCGDGKVTLWKENLKGVWECVSDMTS